MKQFVMTQNQSISNLRSDCQVIASIPSGMISGVDIFATHLVRQLIQRGVKVKIVSTSMEKNSATTLPLDSDLPLECLDHLFQARGWRQRWQLMIDYLEAHAPCIYIPNYDYAYSSVSPKLSARVKIVGIAHSDDPVHYEHVTRLGHTWDAIVGVSQAITQQIATLMPSLQPRLHTIPYGVELPITRLTWAVVTDEPLRLIYCGRLEQEQKRVMDMMEVAQTLQKHQIPFLFTLVGDGSARSAMEERCSTYGLQERIIFTGKLPNRAVAQQLQQNTIFLLTSSYEGLPVSLLEAMSHGLVPVVSAIRSGIPELVRHGENGLLSTIGDIEGFADQLAYLYHNPAHRQQMAQAARRTIEQEGYCLEDMLNRYLQLFQTVLTQPFARPPGDILPPQRLQYALSLPATIRYKVRRILIRILRQIPSIAQRQRSNHPEQTVFAQTHTLSQQRQNYDHT